MVSDKQKRLHNPQTLLVEKDIFFVLAPTRGWVSGCIRVHFLFFSKCTSSGLIKLSVFVRYLFHQNDERYVK